MCSCAIVVGEEEGDVPDVKDTLCVVERLHGVAVREARGVLGQLLCKLLPVAQLSRVFKLCLCLIDLVCHLCFDKSDDERRRGEKGEKEKSSHSIFF